MCRTRSSGRSTVNRQKRRTSSRAGPLVRQSAGPPSASPLVRNPRHSLHSADRGPRTRGPRTYTQTPAPLPLLCNGQVARTTPRGRRLQPAGPLPGTSKRRRARAGLADQARCRVIAARCLSRYGRPRTRSPSRRYRSSFDRSRSRSLTVQGWCRAECALTVHGPEFRVRLNRSKTGS